MNDFFLVACANVILHLSKSATLIFPVIYIENFCSSMKINSIEQINLIMSINHRSSIFSSSSFIRINLFTVLPLKKVLSIRSFSLITILFSNSTYASLAILTIRSTRSILCLITGIIDPRMDLIGNLSLTYFLLKII